jgi:hypothetical protein
MNLTCLDDGVTLLRVTLLCEVMIGTIELYQRLGFVTSVVAMAAVHEQVHQGAQEYQCVWQVAGQVN